MDMTTETPNHPKAPWSTGKKLGCGCLVALVLVLGSCGALAFGILGVMKSTAPYQYGATLAQADARVAAALGEPIEFGMFPTGSINIENSLGQADLHIPIMGPQGSGTVHVLATRINGEWQYTTVTFRGDGSESDIDLLSQPAKP
jgi:hypothetical protein